VVGGLAWSPDGKALIFTDYRTLRLCRVPIGGNQPATPIELAGPQSFRPSTTASRDRLVFVRQLMDYDVYRFDVGRPAEPVLASSPADYSPSFSPDGRRIAFFASKLKGGPQDVWRVPAAGGAEERITHEGGTVPYESIDGRTLYFLRRLGAEAGPGRPEGVPLLSLPVGGGTERQIVACTYSFAVGPGGV